MYITTQQLAKQLVQENSSIDQIIQVLQTIRALVSKHGKFVFRPQIIESIQKIDADVAKCMTILYQTGKKTTQDIKSLITIVKEESSQYTKQFVITAPAASQKTLEEVINKAFTQNNIQKNETDKSEVSIAGEGRYYQRSLDQDLKKMLNI